MTSQENWEAASDAILQQIAKQAPKHTNPESLLKLAEAAAWAYIPAQPHGSRVTVSR